MMETVPRTAEEIDRLRAAVASMPIYINALVSPDGRTVVVPIRPTRTLVFDAATGDLTREIATSFDGCAPGPALFSGGMFFCFLGMSGSLC